MASLNKLAIRGIRSFDDKQISVIEFFSPVTVIVGHNGSGKTTIIECLKYATTGEQPPNTRGGAFVHDPMLANEREVKAQVKLRFNAANGTRMLAVRNLQVSKKKTGGLTMKTLENILSLADGGEGNKRATISTKCAEIDAEIPHLLGVSKSVLDNVIFCHQEDSYWPLSEPSVLKKKFDDIFEATRYTKALDAIKTLRKDRVSELKTEKERLESLKKEKGHADRLKAKIDEARAQITSKEVQYETLGSELQTVVRSNQRFYDLSTKFRQTFLEFESLTNEVERMEHELAEEKTTTKILTDSDEEIAHKIDNFEQYENDLRQKLRSFKVKQNEVEENTASLLASLNALNAERGTLQERATKHEENLKKREELVRRLAAKYKISGFDRASLDQAAIISFSNKLLEVQVQRERDVDTLTQEGKSKKEDMDSQWQTLKADDMQLRESRTHLKTELKRMQTSLAQTESALDAAHGGAAELLSAERELGDRTARLERLRHDAEVADYERAIADLARRAREIDGRKERLSREQGALAQQSESRARLDLKRSEAEKAEGDVKAILKTNTVKFRRLVGADPQPDTMEREIDRVVGEKDAEVGEAETEYESSSRRLGEIEAQLSTFRSQLSTKQAEMKDLERKLATALGDPGLTIKEALENAQDELSHVKSDHSNRDAVLSVFEDIFAKSKSKKKCMTCDRAIGPHEMPDFDKYMERQLTKNRKAVADPDERGLEELEQDVARLKKLLPIEDHKDRLKKTELPTLERQIREAEAKLPELSEDAEKKQEALSQARRDQKEIQSLKLHAATVTRLRKAITDAEREIDGLEAQLSTGEPLRSAETIEQEMQAMTEEWRVVDNKRHTLSAERDRFLKEQQQLAESVHVAQRQVDTLQRQVEDAKKLEQSVAEYKKQIQAVKEQSKDVEVKISDAEKPLRELAARKEGYEREFDERMQVARGLAQEVNRSVDQLEATNKDIQAYIKVNVKAKLTENSESIESAQHDIEESRNAGIKLQEQVEQVTREIGAGEGEKQTLQSNRRMRNLARSINEKKQKLSEIDIEDAARARRQFDEQYPKEQAREESLRAQHSRLAGEIDTIKASLATQEQEMDDFKDIQAQYRNQLVKVKMSDMANNDLEKYAKALDHAIMKYHSLKMEEVNDTMKHLWNKTYQGTDIDGIKICADSEGASVAGKRSYNYRVVMTKDHVEMDMRGRCSAGQKMLASIIIRLALSDSFGQNCGILALDEPTNALDTENIDALASSLVDIINARKGNSNFQLIVITHDEQFLRKLGEAEVMEYYWRVSRDSRQKSVIERQRFG